MVEMEKAELAKGLRPATNMWCPQSRMPRKPMRRVVAIMSAVGEDAAVAEVGQQHGGEAQAGEDGDVDLGVSEEPEEMEPEERAAVAAAGGGRR